MLKTALYVRLEAKPGKEEEVEAFLKAGLPIVMEEPATVAWFGLRLGPTTFGIFDHLLCGVSMPDSLFRCSSQEFGD